MAQLTEQQKICDGPGPYGLCDFDWGVLLGLPLPHPGVKHPTEEQHPYRAPTLPSSSSSNNMNIGNPGGPVQEAKRVLDSLHVNFPPVSVSKVAMERSLPSPRPSEELKRLVLHAIKGLAGMCDGARTKDDKGFDGADTEFGHSVARQTFISSKQFPIRCKLVKKYHRQLPGEVVKAVKDWEGRQEQR